MSLLLWSSLQPQRLEPKILVLIYWNVHLPLTTEGGTRRQGPVMVAGKSRFGEIREGSGGEVKYFTRAPGVVGLSDTRDCEFQL